MKYFRLTTTNPYYNLAVEEYFFNKTEEEVFILWQNEPCVVIGKNQNAFAEINMDYLNANDIRIARRITGGGAVFHDLGNVNYTYIAKSRESLDFAYYSKPIIDVLSSMGVNVHLSGRNDLLTEDGRKISGSAEYSKNGRTLHHGTLLFDSKLETLSSVLNVDPEKLKANAVKSTRSRVANIKDYINSNMTSLEFVLRLEEKIIDRFSPDVISPPENVEIQALCDRNASDAWLFPEKDFLSVYNIIKRKKYDFGLVEISIELKNETIRRIDIKGDFFEVRDVNSFSSRLVGRKISEISSVLSSLNISDYIFGMGNSEFLELIKE